MSEWGIKLKGRKEIVQIQKVSRRYHSVVPVGIDIAFRIRKRHSAKVPAIDIIDTAGRKHTLTAVDFNPGEWKKIKEGSRIEVEIGELIRNARVL